MRIKEDELQDLVRKCWNHYDKHVDESFVVKPSVPILYFGNLKKYLDSHIRIVTVGLNPSNAEFPIEDPFYRFEGLTALSRSGLAVEDTEFRRKYLDSINSYFNYNPYSRWFDQSYLKILMGMEASFYGKNTNTAIHTDICTPLATNPTWSKLRDSGLSDRDQQVLIAEGVQIWANLVRTIKPDIVLISIAKKHLDRIPFRKLTPWSQLFAIEYKENYEFTGSVMNIIDDHRSLFVFGKANRKPFLGLSSKFKAGELIMKHYLNTFPKGKI